ncbi:MAG: hypothetical protein H7Z37_11240 [Pyrinomonadaceae bacterium]|nr:hypothetical protein [Pyrinomonadaceae bacterium]
MYGLITEAGFEIASGLIALYSFAIVFGGYAGKRIERNHQNNKLLCFVIGIGLAVGCVLAAILTGALVGLLREAVTNGTEIAFGQAVLYLFTVPAYIMLYASLPAAVLGILYTILVIVASRRNRLRAI